MGERVLVDGASALLGPARWFARIDDAKIERDGDEFFVEYLVAREEDGGAQKAGDVHSVSPFNIIGRAPGDSAPTMGEVRAEP